MEPVSQELKRLNNGDEHFETALKGAKIKTLPDNDLKACLKFVMLVVGIRTATIAAMDDIEKQVLISFFRKNYGNHTTEEIKLAFEKAVARELNLEEKQVSAYENFTCEYVGRIMNAYRIWASTLFSQVVEERPLIHLQTLPPAAYHPTDWVKECYADFLNGKLNLETLPERVYEIAGENGLLVVSNRRKIKLLRRAKKHVQNFYQENLKEIDKKKKPGEHRALSEKVGFLKNCDLYDSVNDGFVNRYVKAITLHAYFCEIRTAGLELQTLCLL